MNPTLIAALPTVNAVLNGVSAILLLTGFYFIRRRRVTAHKICMLSAFVTSIIFLLRGAGHPDRNAQLFRLD